MDGQQVHWQVRPGPTIHVAPSMCCWPEILSIGGNCSSDATLRKADAAWGCGGIAYEHTVPQDSGGVNFTLLAPY